MTAISSFRRQLLNERQHIPASGCLELLAHLFCKVEGGPFLELFQYPFQKARMSKAYRCFNNPLSGDLVPPQMVSAPPSMRNVQVCQVRPTTAVVALPGKPIALISDS